MAFIRLTRLKFVGLLLLGLVLYNEWFAYFLKYHSWPYLEKPDSDEIRLLLVADPQMLSTISEPDYPFSIIAVWDANRFVSTTFQYALSYSQPNVIVFLGDLINDGSISTDREFFELVHEFKKQLYIPSYVERIFFIPGDNDIGGEGRDEVSANKIDRFYNAFSASNTMKYKFLQLFHLNNIPGATNDISLPSKDIESEEHNRQNILFSHYPLLAGGDKLTKETIKKINPSVMFSAHDHDSYRYIGRKVLPQAEQFWVLRDEYKRWEINLNSDELSEISVPTCSYRMGKKSYGYGLAIINKSGILNYMVLWLPSRFNQLWSYLWCLCFSFSLLILPAVLYLARRCSRIQSDESQSKTHKV